ncbi:MAG TPA: hypothetical protein VG501_00760 [Rhizomicrobium sp.]|nr:hypothetical protein [Rhizomicrobium sp.]
MPRECGTCTLCCKVMGIKEIDKPSGSWCPHCRPGKGCAIYSDRPEECRTFFCDWLAHDYLGPEWKPEKSKIVLRTRDDRTVAYVDPATPTVWKKPPYIDGLLHMMRALLPQNRLVYVSVAEHYTLLLPDRFEELGPLGSDDQVMLKTIRTGTGIEYKVEVLRGAGP